MAWALVGTNGNNSSASSPLGITKTSGGSTLRIAILARTASNDVYTAVTDTGGNTWTKRADSGASGVGRRIEIWDSVNGAAITALSAAFTGSGTALGAVFEWSGHHATPFDAATALVRASTTTPAAATVTPSASSNLVIAGCMANPNTAALDPAHRARQRSRVRVPHRPDRRGRDRPRLDAQLRVRVGARRGQLQDGRPVRADRDAVERHHRGAGEP